MKRTLAVVAVALSLAAPARAAAGEASSSKRAEDLFRDGIAAFERERYSDAYGSLRAAFDLEPTYRTAGGLGQVELQLGQLRDAAEHLTFCLRNFPEDGDPEVRQQVERGLGAARKQVAALDVRVDVDGAEVEVDGDRVGRSPLEQPVFVVPGAHVVRATRAGHGGASQSIEARADTTRQVAFAIGVAPSAPTGPTPGGGAEPAGPPPAPSPLPEPAPDRGTRDGVRPAVWVLVGGGALTLGAAVTAVVFGVRASDAQDDIDRIKHELGDDREACHSESAATREACASLQRADDEHDSATRGAVVAGVTAGVLAAATAVTTILLWDDGDSARVSGGAVPGGGVVAFEAWF